VRPVSPLEDPLLNPPDVAPPEEDPLDELPDDVESLPAVAPVPLDTLPF